MAEVRERFSSTYEEPISEEELMRVCDWLTDCCVLLDYNADSWVPGMIVCGLGWCLGVPRLLWYRWETLVRDG